MTTKNTQHQLMILKPSPLHGVGVFAVKSIRKGTILPLFAQRDWRWVGRPVGKERRFCTVGDGGFYAPANWHRMSIGWFLNEDSTPNVYAKNWRSLRYIKAGEELTITYSEL